MPALQKATQMTDEAMTLLDDKVTLRGTKHFGATMYSVSHKAKFFTHHWYTARRAYKFGQVDSAECKCCRDGVKEITAHILQCPNRNEVEWTIAPN